MRILATLILALPLTALAQPFAIGSRSVTFFDASRNRNIATDVYYPGVSAGSNVAVADGSFPVLVMGHGFVMGTDAYANLWNHFVPRGYILALPTTEGGFGPSHSAFGQDLAFVAQALQAANTQASSPFFGRVAPATALMGHSMGGGASFLGAANNTAITTVVNFAAAETSPSAVAACAQVQVPTLMFAASNDCVTPVPNHTAPMYAALTVPCRAFVNITGGGHCYFANYNFNCAFGELTCSPSPAITRAQQHSVVNDFAALWLDHFLKGEEAALQAFLDSAASTTRAACTATCDLTTALSEAESDRFSIWPSVTADRFLVRGFEGLADLRILDTGGRAVMAYRRLSPGSPVEVARLAPGAYLVLLEQHGSAVARRLVVTR